MYNFDFVIYQSFYGNLKFLSYQELLDYEVDSDDEWEEEEPGESLSHSEGVSDMTLLFL